MASTKADNNRVAWTYTDDNAHAWRTSAKAVYVLDGTDGAKFGGSAGSESDELKPHSIRMRMVKCKSAGHPMKYVVAYETDATVWTTPGTEVTLNLNGVDVVYTTTKGKRQEHNPDGIQQTA